MIFLNNEEVDKNIDIKVVSVVDINTIKKDIYLGNEVIKVALIPF